MSDSDLEKLLAERRELDRKLMDQHAREVAVLFTDIVGSTNFFERKGDIEGLALVKRHNDALFPIVTATGGRVVKTIGDAIMAVFDTPRAAADCGAQMQQTLAKMNAAAPGEGEIHIRIGIHAGRALLDKGDLFGDTVNVAARVNHEARADEVLHTEAVCKALGDHPCWPRGEVKFKGKSEPMSVRALNWGPGAPPPETGVVHAERSAAEPKPASRPEQLFVLELARGAEGLRVSVMEGDKDKGTVKAYADVALGADALDGLARSFGAFMHQGPSSYREQVRELGEKLFAEALSDRAQRKLAQTELRHVRLQLDDALVQVPWELLHDGVGFLGLRHAVGRIVATRAQTSPGIRLAAPELTRALVVSNPSGDLPAAAREGNAVAGLLREGGGFEVTHLEGPVTRAKFLEAVQGAHWLHVAGHTVQGEKGAGFVLSDGVVSASALMEAVGAQVPSVIFANGCRASGEQWFEAARGVGSLAAGLLLRGVQHYLGPMWELPDEDGLAFALRFYEHALSGAALGEAVRRAREALYEKAQTPLGFAGYVLYGDPRKALPPERTRLAPQPSTRSGDHSGPFAMPPLPRATGKGTGDGVSAVPMGLPLEPAPPQPVVPRKLAVRALGVAGAVCIALGGAVIVLGTHRATPTPPPVAIQPVPKAGPAPADPARHTGPLRLVALPFKNVSADPKLDYLKEAWPEELVTDLAGKRDYQLIERGQLDVDLGELAFSQNEKIVDPATRAQLGKIQGAEVVVLGSFQKEGETVRASARFVNAETGEVLAAVKVDKPADKLLDLQDAVSAKMLEAVQTAHARMRP